MGFYWESDIRVEMLGKWILGKVFEVEEQDVQCFCFVWLGKSREIKQSYGQGENGRRDSWGGGKVVEGFDLVFVE